MRDIRCVVLVLIGTFVASIMAVPECRSNKTCRLDSHNESASEKTFYFAMNTTKISKEQDICVKIKQEHNQTTITLECHYSNENIGYKVAINELEITMSELSSIVKKVEIRRCTVPTNGSYYKALQYLDINVSSLESLTLTGLPAEPQLEGGHFDELTIGELLITANDSDNPIRPKFNFLDKLPNLRILELRQHVMLGKEIIEHLPKALEKLILSDTGLPAAESELGNGSYWLKRLNSLKELYIWEREPSNRSGGSKIKTLLLPALASLPNLEKATLINVPLHLPRNLEWLNGSKLNNLQLQSCGLSNLPRDLFKGAKLSKLDLSGNNLTLPEKIFSSLIWLTELNLSNNKLSGLTLQRAVNNLQNLEVLKVNRNPLGSLCGDGVLQGILTAFWLSPIGLQAEFKILSSYEKLLKSIVNCVHSAQCQAPLKKFSLQKRITKIGPLELVSEVLSNGNPLYRNSNLPLSLRLLELRSTGALRICDDWIDKFPHLMEINLNSNKINMLSYSDLMMTRRIHDEKQKVTLSIKNNPLRKISVTEEDFLQCINASSDIRYSESDIEPKQRVEVYLELTNLTCNCDAYWLRKTLLNCSQLLTMDIDSVGCDPSPPKTKPQVFKYYNPSNITCAYRGSCPTECICVVRAFDNATVMRCANILPPVSQWPPAAPGWPLALYAPPGSLTAVPPVMLVELHAPNNNITHIDNIPNTLRGLDVRNNRITHISFPAAKLLGGQEANKNTHSVFLAGNPLVCECADARAFGLLKRVVRDWDKTQCVDETYISTLTKNDLCPTPNPLPHTVTIVLIIICVVITALCAGIIIYKVIKFLRSHIGLDLVRIEHFPNNEKNEKETEKDFFISYVNSDLREVQIVKQGLDKLGYTYIDHSRDWQPGEAVIDQIICSVRKTQWTILFVSDKYGMSQWTLIEFDIAYKEAGKHGIAGPLIVRCNLEAPEKLPESLKFHFEVHTHLDFEDSNFWVKFCRNRPPLGLNHETVLKAARHMEPPSTTLRKRPKNTVDEASESDRLMG